MPRPLTRLLGALVAVAAGVALVLLPAPASAQAGGSSGDSTFDFSEHNGTGDGPHGGTGATGASTGSTSVPPPLFDYGIVYGREEVGQEPGFDAAGCWGVTQVAADDPAGLTYAEAAAGADEWGGNGTGQGRCVDDPAEVFDIDAYVQAVWRTSVRPPPPSPLAVAPGKALTGLRSYLEIGGDVPYELAIPNPVGADIVLVATPRYVVRWGDGATDETTSQGVPYPGGDGEITHVYTDKGGVTITVEAYWHGTWTAGDAGGTLPELPTPTEASLALPVEERQVVVD